MRTLKRGKQGLGKSHKEELTGNRKNKKGTRGNPFHVDFAPPLEPPKSSQSSLRVRGQQSRRVGRGKGQGTVGVTVRILGPLLLAG